MTQKVALTGDRPTGPMHLGHYIGSFINRVELQKTYKQYVMVADIQALTDNFENPQKVRDNVYEVTKDYIAVGIDPNLSTIFIQSQVTALTELTVYFMNMVTLGRLERNPTVKAEIQQKGYDDSIPVGFFCYPISQAADILSVKADVVPVGDDQVPMVEQANEIARKFNRIYKTDCLKEAEVKLSQTPRLVGIDGKAKASKSLNNTIFLKDDEKTIKDKVFSMYTDPDHLKVSDPGKVEGNVVFTYLDAFHQDKNEVAALKEHYKKGGLGDVTVKNLLNNTLQELLRPIRENRAQVTNDMVLDILKTGTRKTADVANETLDEVRKAIGVCYFE